MILSNLTMCHILFRTTVCWIVGNTEHKDPCGLDTSAESWILLTPMDPEPLHPAVNKTSSAQEMRGNSMFYNPWSLSIWDCLSFNMQTLGPRASSPAYTHPNLWCRDLTCCESRSALAAITKHHRRHDLNNINFSHFGGWIQCQGASRVSIWGDCPSWLGDSHLLPVPSHGFFPELAWGRKVRSLVFPPLVRAQSCWISTLPL